MHELSVATGLLSLIEDEMKKAGGSKVSSVSLRIGKLSGVVPEYLKSAFEACTKGTFAEDAQVNMEIVEPEVVCLECGTRFGPEDFVMECGNCGSWRSKFLRGNEMLLTSLEVEVD